MNKEFETRLHLLERKHLTARKTNFILGLLLLGLVFYSFTGAESFNIIRAKGIIIEDEMGRDRVLIGAPIPFSKDRVRTDTSKVRKYWSGNFGAEAENYMRYYKDYKHSTDGIVVLNEEGFDRVLVGDKLADPNTGKKMFESAGITWNDKNGWELGGAGVNTSEDGTARGVMGLDDPKTGGEAIHLVSLEDGTKALILGGSSGRLMIAMNSKESEILGTSTAFTGLKFFSPDGKLLWEKQLLKH